VATAEGKSQSPAHGSQMRILFFESEGSTADNFWVALAKTIAAFDCSTREICIKHLTKVAEPELSMNLRARS
jgi:hypothetical protein